MTDTLWIRAGVESCVHSDTYRYSACCSGTKYQNTSWVHNMSLDQHCYFLKCHSYYVQNTYQVLCPVSSARPPHEWQTDRQNTVLPVVRRLDYYRSTVVRYLSHLSIGTTGYSRESTCCIIWTFASKVLTSFYWRVLSVSVIQRISIKQYIHPTPIYNKKRVMDVDDDDDDGKMVAAVSTPVTVAEPKAHLCSPTRSTTAGTAFRLPDGRWMDSKNTLQSFDVAAAAARPPHRRVAAASASTVTPSSSPHVVPTSHARTPIGIW